MLAKSRRPPPVTGHLTSSVPFVINLVVGFYGKLRVFGASLGRSGAVWGCLGNRRRA